MKDFKQFVAETGPAGLWQQTPITYNETESLLNPNFYVLGDPEVDWQAVFIAHPPNFR